MTWENTVTGNPITLDPGSVDLPQLEAVAHGSGCELSEPAMVRVNVSHRRLERYLDENRRIYGVTTGYGPLANTMVGRDHAQALQRNLVAHLSSGVGAPLERDQTRATMAARATALGLGHSGVSPEAIKLLLQCLNADAIPVVPSMGTVGASGDLTPLAHIAGALMGEGEMCHRNGPPEPAAEVLSRLGFEPFTPGGKDALALVNGTSAMTGIAGLNGMLAERALKWSCLITAAHGQALNHHQEAWHPAFGAVRPHGGQQRLHRWLNALDDPDGDAPPTDAETIAESTLEQLEQPIQDPYSIRCAPQLLGAVSDQLDWHNQVVTTELNSVTDNPILPDEVDGVLHGGNFYGQHVAFASDALANAVITMGVHAERRIARLSNPRLNQGLPAFLQAEKNGLQSGFMGAQVTASALLAEMRTQATPASIQSIPTNGDNQDVVTMGTIGARRTHHLMGLLFRLLAIDALMATQALELRAASSGADGASKAIAGLCAWVRRHAPPLKDDRALSREIEVTAEAMRQPRTLVDAMPEMADHGALTS